MASYDGCGCRLTAGAGAGLQVTLQQNLGGYTGVADLSMEGHPNQDMRLIRWANLGDRTTLYTYSDGPTPIRTTALKFGGIEAALPGATSSADITSATLSLYARSTATGSAPIYKALHAWTEGTGGAVGTTLRRCALTIWISRNTRFPWTPSPGGT